MSAKHPSVHTALLPEGWKRPRGYANGVSASGRQVFVAGMVGWDAQERFTAQDFVGQTRQALLNVLAVLHAGGASPAHIARMTWYVTSRAQYHAALPEIGGLFRELIGNYSIAMSAVEVSALMEPQALVEIEVTAVVPEPTPEPTPALKAAQATADGATP